MLGSFHLSAWPQVRAFIRPPIGNSCCPCGHTWLAHFPPLNFLCKSTVPFIPNTPSTYWVWKAVLSAGLAQTSTFLPLRFKPLHITTYPRTLGCGPQIWEGTSQERIGRLHFTFTHKSTISCYSQEKNFKILSWWYRDPATLHRIFPSTPASSRRCGSASGTYLHVWWECERIRPFLESGISSI